jgi:glutathione S-transferase
MAPPISQSIRWEGAGDPPRNTVVTESADLRLSRRRIPATLLAPPPGDRLRGPYYRWLFFVAGPLDAAWTNKTMGFVVPRERERMMGYGRFEARHRRAEGAVSRAEMWSATAYRCRCLSLGRHWLCMQFGDRERPAFEQYWQRLSARPAAIRAREKSTMHWRRGRRRQITGNFVSRVPPAGGTP